MTKVDKLGQSAVKRGTVVSVKLPTCLYCGKPLSFHRNEVGKTLKFYHSSCRKLSRAKARKPVASLKS